MKLELASLGLAMMVIASAIAFEENARWSTLELPEFDSFEASSRIAVQAALDLAPALEPVAVCARTVASLERDSGAREALDAAWEGRPKQKAWNWQIIWTSDRCFADSELNPACKSLDEQGKQRLDALLAELNQAVQETQRSYNEEARACRKKKLDAGKFELVPEGERIRADPRALTSTLFPVVDGKRPHVQLFRREFRQLDLALARRDESQAKRRERVREWIAAW
jgi:hypothetical protein